MTAKAEWHGVVVAESPAYEIVEGKENADAAWFYPEPKPAAANIKDHVAFWKGVTVTR